MSKASGCFYPALLLAGLLCLSSGCGLSGTAHSPKTAYLRYQEVAAAHPSQAKLRVGQAVLRTLEGRELQERRLLAAQLGGLEQLSRLKTASAANFLAAEYDTKLYEARRREAALLEQRLAAAQEQAEELVSQRRQAVEEDYRLRLFNLRLELENTRPLPRVAASMTRAELRQYERDAKARMEAVSAKLKQERDAKVAAIEAEKAGHVRDFLGPDLAASRERLAAEASKGQAELEARLAAEQQKKLPPEAEAALTQALTVLEREQTKQRLKNQELSRKIEGDIVSLTTKIAKERGYSIVYRDVVAAGTAEDITEELKAQLAKLAPAKAEDGKEKGEGR